MVDDASGRVAIQKTTSNELLHNVKQVIVGHDYERYHEWRDFTELEIQHYRDGKMISSTSTIKPGEKRTTVPYGFGGGLVKAMDWASSIMPSATKEADRDGIVFTTKSKLFPGNDGGKYNAKGRGEIVDVDQIVGAFGVAGFASGASRGTSIGDAIKYLRDGILATDAIQQNEMSLIDVGSETSETTKCP